MAAVPLPTLDRGPALALADGGASAHETPHTLVAFTLARRLGCDAIATRAACTADGRVVLAAPRVPVGRRRRPLETVRYQDLRPQPPVLADLDPGVAWWIEIGDDGAGEEVMDWAEGQGATVLHRDWRWLAERRSTGTGVRLIHRSRRKDLETGTERHVANLRAAGIDGLDLPEDDWSAGMVALCHRFGRLAVARGAEHEHQLARLVGIGIDVVASTHVDRLAEAVRAGRND